MRYACISISPRAICLGAVADFREQTGHAWLRYIPLSWNHDTNIRSDEAWLKHGG
jgi:hypothetical protein